MLSYGTHAIMRSSCLTAPPPGHYPFLSTLRIDPPMKSPRMTALVLLAVCFGSVALAGDLAFNKDIRPILAEHCLSCHGPGKKNGGLRLDQPEAAFKGGKSGTPAVVAGKPEKSALIERIHSDVETERMPPASTWSGTAMTR